MTAYVLVDIDVHDPERYEQYKILSGRALEPYGGRFIARGGRTRRLEGRRTPHRTVVLAFPDFESAEAWWNSPEYASAKALRQQTATTEMVVVEGV